MEKFKMVVKLINVIAIFASSPLMLFVVLYGIDGLQRHGVSDPVFLMAIGYGIAFIFGILTFHKEYFLYVSLCGWLIFGLGNILDVKKTTDSNDTLCAEVRAEPSCMEDACGFDCSNLHGGGAIIPGSVCKNKDTSLCGVSTSNAMPVKNEKSAVNDVSQNALNAYAKIVDKIIASPSPTQENFENQLVAIYNCLEKELGSGVSGEQQAVQILTKKNLTQQQLSSYYVYLSSKGRNVNTSKIVAGLPGGDARFSCESIAAN